jgi:hypothetical protein
LRFDAKLSSGVETAIKHWRRDKTMVKALIIFLALGTFNLFASENPYTLESSVSKESLELKIATIATFESSCALGVIRMNITRAIGFQPGIIDLLVVPTKSCTQNSGPNSMIFTLPRGNALPKIPDGFYQILINGEFYQTIDVLPNRGSETGNG